MTRTKIIRKAVSIVIAIILLMNLTTVVWAVDESSVNLYALSSANTAAQTYAVNKVSVFAYASGYAGNMEDLKLGTGITIYDPDDVDKVLFPVWENDEIIATFLVTVIDEGTCSGSYSAAYALQLNAIKRLTSQANPLSLVVIDDGFFGVIGNQWYDLNGTAGQGVAKVLTLSTFTSVINAHDSVCYSVYMQPRITNRYVLPFTPSGTQTSVEGGVCYAYAMSAILQNMGFYKYTPQTISTVLGDAGATKSQLAGYLSAEGFCCTYSDIGYMPLNDVKNRIYHQHDYIYISAKADDNSGYHAMVLFGYFDDGANALYYIWNPWYTYTQVIDATTRNIPTENTVSFDWNHGYIYNIYKIRQN